ncbi:hypothetical protein QUF61_06400 [Candidatus Venteria ishoeyi]|uniref:hypothetical protein n=1 Tax=Candidatus Venteria ishoeyi TaxID=1899563 RepID=UPI0025A5EBF3|nr:hypothetical protein [Candidatus Venteria ishoeyi]MDM8546107.1 hypothetical protein [Candidatus Venteria ishoeyi]
MSEAAKQQANDNLRWWEWISLPSLMTALIYVIGWSYAYAYYAAFNLGLLSIDIPGQYFIIYGFWVLSDHWWLLLLYLGIVAIWWLLRKRPRIQHALATALVPILILALFVGAYQLARYSAVQHFQAQQQQDYPAYPRVKIWLKDKVQQPPDLQVVSDALPKGCYRLLLQSGRQALLFYTYQDKPGLQPAVLHIPMGEVRALRVLPQYGSCS